MPRVRAPTRLSHPSCAMGNEYEERQMENINKMGPSAQREKQVADLIAKLRL